MTEIAYSRIDPISIPFWDAATRHELMLQQCRACGRYQFYPRPICLACLSFELDWVTARGTGVIYSKTTVRRQVGAALSPAATLHPPYDVAIVQLDEGPRMLTRLVGDACKIGDRVGVTWQDGPDGLPVILFGPLPLAT